MAILQSNLHSYSPILLEALKFIAEQEAKEKEIRSISVNELLNGMILLEDLVTEDGLLVLRHSNEISGNLLNLIKFFSAKHRLKEPVKVLVPTG